jgi:oxygen-independent coproporphyrinogen III oxidase
MSNPAWVISATVTAITMPVSIPTMSATPDAADKLLDLVDSPGPRYTSYPTADRFAELHDSNDLRAALQLRKLHWNASAAPLSVYVHIPFCRSLCYYCACNKIVTRRPERSIGYLEFLQQEIGLYTGLLGQGHPVSQLHLGGGTPTFLDDRQLQTLLQSLAAAFELRADAERSIEIDPRTVNAHRLQALRSVGFNRISFGVQDFDPAVQAAVHRVQPQASVEALMAAARRSGFDSINLDLIYGLPLQTPESFGRTLQAVQALRPDRIAIYGYAHLPLRFKAQRRIDADYLPKAAQRIAMLSLAIRVLTEAGYVHIGMDHFALPDDALAVAKAQGRLQRNFQGYSTQPDADLIGLGVSAIGRVGGTYYQNARELDAYAAALHAGGLPVARGLTLTRDDMIRRAVIAAIMCQGSVHFQAIEQAWLIDFSSYFRHELDALLGLQRKGLLHTHAQGFELTASGWLVVRAVAMLFDRYVRFEQTQAQFSNIA